MSENMRIKWHWICSLVTNLVTEVTVFCYLSQWWFLWAPLKQEHLMCHLLELWVDPRGATSSAFISDTTQFKTQCTWKCPTASVNVRHWGRWEPDRDACLGKPLLTTRTCHGCYPGCPLSLTHSLDYIQELKRRDAEGWTVQQHFLLHDSVLPARSWSLGS